MVYDEDLTFTHLDDLRRFFMRSAGLHVHHFKCCIFTHVIQVTVDNVQHLNTALRMRIHARVNADGTPQDVSYLLVDLKWLKLYFAVRLVLDRFDFLRCFHEVYIVIVDV